MPGRAALLDKSGALSDIRGLAGNSMGIGVSDTSEIGGAGRKGSPLTDPMYTRIDAEVMSKSLNGMATGGNTGYVSGSGRTFSGGAGKRAQD